MSYYEYKANVKRIVRIARKREENVHKQAISDKLTAKAREIKQARKKALLDPVVKLPDEITLDSETVREYSFRISNNALIAEYYELLYSDTKDNALINKSENVRRCSQSWFFDHYRLQGVKDLKSIFFCHDKFCLNCQKLLQASRLKKYSPIIDDLLEQGKHLYHVVFTLVNVNAFELKATIKKMFQSFKKVIRYLSGNAKSALKLDSYGFLGAVRSLEITFSNKYHTHLHCVFAFDKQLYTTKEKINNFSYSNENGKRVFKRFFSEFEITLQKVWYCLINGIKVTPDNVDKLKEGYSCTCDEIICNYYEAFKYTIKLQDKDGALDMTFENFKALYNALKGVHVFQGYGCMYRVGVDEIDETLKNRYNFIIAQLQLIEMPDLECVKLNELVMSLVVRPDIKYITRKNIMLYLKQHPEFLCE